MPQPPPAAAVDPYQEYVSGTGYHWASTYLRGLPQWVDDLSRDFGEDLYDRMQLDAQVQSCLENLKYAILRGGVNLTPCRKQGEDDYEKANEIADFCRRNLDRLDRPFESETLHDLLDAMALGNRVAEQVYETPSRGPLAGQLCLRALKVKPRQSYAFVVDPYFNCYGLLGLVPGSGSTILTNSILTDPKDIPNLFPRRKFAVLTYRPVSGDPRGTSLLRAAYDPWWLKQQTKAEYGKFLALHAMEKLIATTPENAQSYPLTQPDGTAKLDGNGNPIYISPEQALVNALEALKNGSIAAFPFGTVIQPLLPTGGEAFSSAFEFFDNQIAKSILGQTRATEEAQHGSRADSQTGQDVMGLHVAFGKAAVVGMIRSDLLRNLIEYNFGLDALELMPNVSLGQTEQQDFAAEATAIAALETAGYFVPEQLPELDARLGLPIRSPEAVEAAQAVSPAQAALPPPTAPGADPNAPGPASGDGSVAPLADGKAALKAKYQAKRDSALGPKTGGTG